MKILVASVKALIWWAKTSQKQATIKLAKPAIFGYLHKAEGKNGGT